MSTSFRPVNEVWGEHSSCFVNGDLMLWVLLTIAAEAGTHSEAYEYGDKTSSGSRMVANFSNLLRATASRQNALPSPSA